MVDLQMIKKNLPVGDVITPTRRTRYKGYYRRGLLNMVCLQVIKKLLDVDVLMAEFAYCVCLELWLELWLWLWSRRYCGTEGVMLFQMVDQMVSTSERTATTLWA